METFDDFMYHVRSVEHPTSADVIQLGNGYRCAVRNPSPRMKRFSLTFKGWKYYYTHPIVSTQDFKTVIGSLKRDTASGTNVPYDDQGNVIGILGSDNYIRSFSDNEIIGMVTSERLLDTTTNFNVNNFGRLLEFSQRMDITEEFIYNDPLWGATIVSFEEPLHEPEVIEGSGGVVESFEIKLVQVSE